MPVKIRQVEAPLADPKQLYVGVIPADSRQPFDVREVIARIVDGSRLHEFSQSMVKPLLLVLHISGVYRWYHCK